MRINMHDYSGHPFQVELSRELASRGHAVLHNFCTQYVSGRGRLAVSAADPPTLRIEGLSGRLAMRKYSPVRRAVFERSYARAWQRRLAEEPFDVVVACNVPLLTLARMSRHFERSAQPWVLWHQDLYSFGVGEEMERVLPRVLAAPMRAHAERLERVQVSSARSVVAITETMVAQYAAWGIDRSNVHVIPNWAPLHDVTPGARDNPWARRHDLSGDRLRLMYAGTLGRKHNALLLLRILDAIRSQGIDAELVVVCEGLGADELSVQARRRGDVRIMGFQPADELSDMLASADVVLTVLEPAAARYSVPSKVLTYLSAGRPILALVPEANPAAADVSAIGGFVGTPDDSGALAAAEWMADAVREPGRLEQVGANARALAERRFDIGRIADRFERVLGETQAIQANDGTLRDVAESAAIRRTAAWPDA